MTDEVPTSGGPTDEFAPAAQPAPDRARDFWSWLPWILVAVLAPLTVWLVVRDRSRPAEAPAQPPSQPAVASAPAEPAPPKPDPLESWPDGQLAAGMLGYSNVRAYRWSGGVLTGWVEFDDGPKSRRVALDLNEKLAEGWKEDPKNFFGQVIVAKRPVAKGKDEQECWVWVQVQRDVVWPESKGRESRSMVYHGRWRPRGAVEGEIGTGRTVTLLSAPQGEPFYPDKGFAWLELRVEPAPRKE